MELYSLEPSVTINSSWSNFCDSQYVGNSISRVCLPGFSGEEDVVEVVLTMTGVSSALLNANAKNIKSTKVNVKKNL